MNTLDEAVRVVTERCGSGYAVSRIDDHRARLVRVESGNAIPLTLYLTHNALICWIEAFLVGVNEAERINKLETTK